MHSSNLKDRLENALQKRSAEATLRRLRADNHLIDFTSNDDLGFARSGTTKTRFNELLNEFQPDLGSTGSRLLSGNSPLYERLETDLAEFFRSQSALLFNSGFDANMGIFQALPRRGDTILYDQKIHASVKLGARLSLAPSFSFLHNDLEDLERRLKRASGDIFVATEALYSMDGDEAPLREIQELCDRYQAHLIVDEAHSTGVFGEQGRGKVFELGLEDRVLLRLHTFGKALGCHGAAITCGTLLKDYLLNFAHSFIYTTALPPHSLLAIKAALETLQTNDQTRLQLFQLIKHFTRAVGEYELPISPRPGPIQILETGSPKLARELEARLAEKGYGIKAIVAPTVPLGGERLRIVLHAFNTEEEVEGLSAALGKFLNDHTV